MANTKTRIYIYISDLMLLTGQSQPTCWRRYHHLKSLLKKSTDQKLTIQEYCQLENINESLVLEKLGIQKSSNK
jgi:hypothetical protein